jgi:hypothetical protein
MESAKGATLRVQLALKEQEKVSQRTGKQVSVIYIWKYRVTFINTCRSIAYLL